MDEFTALLAYEGSTKDLIRALKYENHRDALDRVGAALAVLVRQHGGSTMTWAPTSTLRRRHRGYDQSELLARRAGSAAAMSVSRLLRRLPGHAQTGLGRSERRNGPAFEAHSTLPERIVLVDDVITTGATLSAAARALRSGGAIEVVGITLAARP